MPPNDAEVASRVLGVLWGKSDAAGSMNLLLQHLLDTAAVGELIWDRFLAPGLKAKVDACCRGRGRALFALLCGLHDVGKASPAFQAKVPALAAVVKAAGLEWRPLDQRSLRWHHTLAGAVVARQVLPGHGWSGGDVGWVWPLIAGHHGVVPGAGGLDRPPGRGNAQGTGPWVVAQRVLVERVAAELGCDVGSFAGMLPPQRAVQLALLGAVIMADWIASAETVFSGVDTLDAVSVASARGRAERAWAALDLRGGWTAEELAKPAGDPILVRFGQPARPVQAVAVALAERMPAPGLLVIEAPMGEGKTEASLAAVEVLARRFGADGVLVGMPTQATSDPMFTRVRGWASSIQDRPRVGLLHGKRRFNREWRALRDRARMWHVDDYGCGDDVCGQSSSASPPAAGEVPAEWFMGAKRGLLVPITVGTIDQVLHAATRTRHVMLRHAGLAGRVVVLDEVHAHDVYMSQFLAEALRWLAGAGVPVIVLSATLPPADRAGLVRAYLQGALECRDIDLSSLPPAAGYPNVLSVSVQDGRPRFENSSAEPWRLSIPVRVEVLDDGPPGDADPVVALLGEALAGGGCALVVRNTVGRAQQTYTALVEKFGSDVVLLHGRLTAGERADRTERVLDLLGRPGRPDGARRPGRLVVVATQLAEQSFDVDVDLLVTDLAPIDLLLQRVGRLHRHDRPGADRPERVRAPRVVVTGLVRDGDGPPRFPSGSEYVYGRYLLLRSAALVAEAVGRGWSVPADVPGLVALGYGGEPVVPAGWAAAAAEADLAWSAKQKERRANASTFLLAGEDTLGTPTLAGLHKLSTAELPGDDAVAAVVRDGPPSVEVVLVRGGTGGYATVGGRPIGPTGESISDDDILDEVVQATVRLPARPSLTKAALAELRPLPGWTADPWLRRARALVLDEAGSASLGGRRLSYHSELGLIDEPEAAR